jgi:predicted alpha/beta superfamily hydrolase
MIASGAYHAGSRFFFAVGDAEETDDRDGDGMIDVLDDTRDLLDGWRERPGAEPRTKGLRQLGHSVHLEHAARATRADAALYVLPGGRHEQTSWAQMLPVFLRWAYGLRAPALEATGTTESWQDVPSRHVAARNVDVWLPPSYGRDPARRYPVLYLHDGQNVFDPALSYTGVDWDIDGAMTRLIERGEIREAIVVGAWNTPLRFAEYMPRAPVTGKSISSGIPLRPAGRTADVVSDAYLRFLVEELKPMIDARYRTRPGREDTLIMGSSMGGLISLYALAQYPEVFGSAAAVSTHWPVCNGCVIDWLRKRLPAPGAHRLYFDYGTATLDAHYPPYQAKMDAAMRQRGYREGADWTTRRFEGAEHNEAAWKARVEIPLRFLLGVPKR